MTKLIICSFFVGLFIVCLSVSGFTMPGPKTKILVFSKTAGFRHKDAIAAGKKYLIQMGKENKFEADTTEDSQAFTIENLNKYAAIVFLCTTGNVLNEEQQKSFTQYIRQGGGYVGLHSASDTEYDWPWFGELNGAYFKSHPKQQEAVFKVVDTNHVSTAHLPQLWKRFDEHYNFKWIGTDLKVLITIDEASYSGGLNGEYHPMAWYHEFDGGRGFYTALGHDSKSWDDPLYRQHVLGGLQYATNTVPGSKKLITAK